ncbi:MAG: SemiSWEET transporter [Parvibaculum sp.]|jgi:MtN3 and saliva related transmembrane protein|uniref:SemiSWEET transporter n=1 Tax=Parvibaculum sp. TaxID=2024848 RepID=UPI002846CAD1|nr:SemiSWEET transporter [Parvibaculum sp.]MDR3499343.1 SemiSWEET transporter [Parvibaculum sp.]
MTIGYIAALLTTISFIPQAIMTIRTHDTEGISVSMYVIFVTGVFFWFVYGVIQRDFAIIAANFLTFVLALPILVIAARNELKRRRSENPS